MRNSFETNASAQRIYFLKLPEGERFLLVQIVQEVENSRE